MPGLRETTAALARLKRQAQALSTGADHGEQRMTETARFGANPGALRMLSYAPDDLAPGAPLVVVLHGCTQRAEAHAEAGGWLALADRYGFVVVAPEQSPANNHNRCFNWYEPEDAARGRGEAASIRAMVAHALREHRLDRRRVFVTGLSAGGAMTSVMLAAYPDVFAAGAVVAGLPYGVADNVQEALGAMYAGRARTAGELRDLVRRAAPAGSPPPRISIWHGDADATVRPHNALAIARQWAAVHDLPPDPDETEALPGRTRLRWRAREGGEVLIESVLIKGFGHGTPLATSGPEGVGSVAPYMLEAGVSSSLEIARFWGLAEAAADGRPAPRRASKPDRLTPSAKDVTSVADQRAGAASLGEQILASVRGKTPAGVEDVIAGALRTAGLMK